jgi:transposase
MPRPGETLTPPHVIEKTLRRYRAGEPVSKLSKELKVSRAAVYLWINAERQEERERVKRLALTPEKAARADKVDLAIENERLKDELRRAEMKIIELMRLCGQL